MNYADFQHILFEKRENGILWLTLNRPEVLNAANRRLHTELVEVWQTIDRDPEVKVAVVTGAGRGFSAGGDLQMVEDAYRNYDEIIRILDEASNSKCRFHQRWFGEFAALLEVKRVITNSKKQY